MLKLLSNNPIRESTAWFGRGKIIRKQVKKDNDVIYGGQSIKKQIGIYGRPTQDYDILSRTPRRSARRLERTLDKQSGGNNYYSQPAQHEGTHKVRHIGMDRKQGTDDDLDTADFTRPERKHKTLKINGVRYTHLSESIRDKKKSLSDPKFKFRHQKDRNDLQRIRLFQSMKKQKKRMPFL